MGAMKCLLLLLCAGVTVSSSVDLHKRIINGKPCDKGERGYHVKLKAKNPTHESLCGGSLISDSYILTAAHCWKDGWEMTAYVGVHPGPADPPEGVKIPESNHHIFKDSNGDHDLMLLKLPTPTKIKPIDLPTEEECKNRQSLTVQVAGYAATTVLLNGKHGNDRPAELQCVEMKVIKCPDFANCHSVKTSTDPFIRQMVHEHYLCEKTDKVDTAPGDSGGGVVYNNKIYGVHKAGGEFACKESAIFMDICDPLYKTWILHMNSLKVPKQNNFG